MQFDLGYKKTPPGLLDSKGGMELSYVLSDIDEAGATYYYGHLDRFGGWVIVQYIPASGTLRYSSATSGYAAAWTGRAGLTYGLYNTIYA